MIVKQVIQKMKDGTERTAELGVDLSKSTVSFEQSAARVPLSSGERLSVLFGKLKKFLTDLKPVAFTGSYIDLTDRPASLSANGGNSDTVNRHTVETDVPPDAVFTDTIYTHPVTDGYRHVPATGTVNNGRFLQAGASAGELKWTTLTKSAVGLDRADNTSDLEKPVSNAQRAIFSNLYECTGFFDTNETILSAASSASKPISKFAVGNRPIPSDAPTKSEGFCEIIPDYQTSGRKIVRWTDYYTNKCYIRAVFNGNWHTDWGEQTLMSDLNGYFARPSVIRDIDCHTLKSLNSYIIENTNCGNASVNAGLHYPNESGLFFLWVLPTINWNTNGRYYFCVNRDTGHTFTKREVNDVFSEWDRFAGSAELKNLLTGYLPSVNATLKKCDDLREGGQINFEGAADFPTWCVDVYENTFRIFANGGSTMYSFGIGGAADINGSRILTQANHGSLFGNHCSVQESAPDTARIWVW